MSVCVNGGPRTALVHRLVLEAFDRPAREHEEAAHRNGDRTDNRLANLRWATKTENMQDASRQGTAGVWMKSRSTLTRDEVSDVRAARARGEKLESIAARFGANKQQVSAIGTGKIFKPAPLAWPIPQLWIGVSVENQDAADERIPELLETPAAVRFLSCEPLLGPVDISEYFDPCSVPCGEEPWTPLDWVIAGCESGPGARPADVAWLRLLRDQCSGSGVPFFLKQAEESVDLGDDRQLDIGDDDSIAFGDGSKLKQRGPGGARIVELPYLDGVQHRAWPEVSCAL